VALCLDSEAGIDEIRLYPSPCAAPPSLAEEIIGDVIVGNLGLARLAPYRVDLGEVECIIEDADVGLVDTDPPEPQSGEVLFVLVRLEGSIDYGSGSTGLPRLPAFGDCSR
jgi:hypothetical protein